LSEDDVHKPLGKLKVSRKDGNCTISVICVFFLKVGGIYSLVMDI